MLSLSPPIGVFHRYDMVEVVRDVRSGAADSPADRTAGWIEASEAAVIPLTEKVASSDTELAAFQAAEAATHVYHYVSFACSFGPAEKTPFDRAWLQVELSAAGRAGTTTAWSMSPRNVWDKAEVSTTANVGAEFKLISTGIEAGISTESKVYFLRAYRERTARPYWEFRATQTSSIDGSHRFHMVTRTSKGAAGRGRLNLSATMRTRKFLMLTRSEAAAAPPAITFDLSE
mgnify:CR=1 FL=1